MQTEQKEVRFTSNIKHFHHRCYNLTNSEKWQSNQIFYVQLKINFEY